MRVLIVGPQGAGKGAQAVLLAAALNIPHISTGDIFRANATAGTDLGALAKKYMDAGELVPDEVTSAMVSARLAETDASAGFLLDGYPRTVPQAQWLADRLHTDGHALNAVLLLTVPNDVLLTRMLARGRADDTAEAIARRLELYHTETRPLLDYYGHLLVTIDGDGPIEEIHQRALHALRAHQQTHLGREVAPGAESLSGGHAQPDHIGREIAAGAESLSGGHAQPDHIGREIAAGAASLSGERESDA